MHCTGATGLGPTWPHRRIGRFHRQALPVHAPFVDPKCSKRVAFSCVLRARPHADRPQEHSPSNQHRSGHRDTRHGNPNPMGSGQRMGSPRPRVLRCLVSNLLPAVHGSTATLLMVPGLDRTHAAPKMKNAHRLGNGWVCLPKVIPPETSGQSTANRRQKKSPDQCHNLSVPRGHSHMQTAPGWPRARPVHPGCMISLHAAALDNRIAATTGNTACTPLNRRVALACKRPLGH